MKTAILTLILTLLVSACSDTASSKNTSPNSNASGLPLFDISRGDIITFSMETTANKPTIVHLELSKAKAAEFLKFTQNHMMHQTQLVLDGKVVAQPTIIAEIPGPGIDLTFSSVDEARAFANSLTKE